ncbi:MAG: DNA-3-methyladenine glycosylase I [Candidatus Obscuribacterales bacterium]|nr:DNA-3-methyladenine glycosylase I [Candidatus Obscuribacterales bacterium]
MAIPKQIDANKLDDYLEVMTKAVFQASVSWAMIDNKWKNFQAAFDRFDAHKVAKYTDADVERLVNDQGIFRSRAKIVATIANAKMLVQLDKEFDGFAHYLHSKKSYKELAADLKKRFKYMGDMNVYYFLFRVKEEVPDFEKWILTIEGEHPRMREMVEAAGKPKAVEK